MARSAPTITRTSIPRGPVKLPTGLTYAGRNRAYARAVPLVVTIEIIGARVLAQHLQACAWAMWNLSAQVVQVTGAYCADWAKMNLAVGENKQGYPHIRTGDLYRSIYAGTDGEPLRVATDGNDLWIDVIAGEGLSGHGDARARFLEWGFRHVGSGKLVRYPYMMPAVDKAAPVFIRAMEKVACIPNRFPDPDAILGTSGPQQTLMRLRPFLYSASRALGDVQVFAGSPLIGKLRSDMLMAARRLGDVNAVMRGAIATRISTHLIGGHLAGIQSGIRMSTLTAGSQYSGMAGRVYNRYVGRGFGYGLKELTTGL